jgi:hypothetical protein
MGVGYLIVMQYDNLRILLAQYYDVWLSIYISVMDILKEQLPCYYLDWGPVLYFME